MSSALFINLTQSHQEGYPATFVIKHLIEFIGSDVCALRRNNQVSYRFVERARDLNDEINRLIKEVDDASDAQSWASYDSYTVAIDPLEELLFAFATAVHDESTLFFPETKSLQACIASIEKWAKNRTEIRSRLDNVRSNALFKGRPDDDADIKAALISDDTTLLNELCQRMKAHKIINTAMKRGIRDLINEVAGGFTSLHTRISSPSTVLNDESVVLSIKCAMVIHGVMEILINTKSEEGVEWKGNAQSLKVWSAAKQLVSHMNEHLEKKNVFSAVQTEYEVFIKLLGGVDVKLPDTYVDLMKCAGKIRRPYYAQALALVSLCRVLAEHFNKKENQLHANLLPLEAAFNDTLQALRDRAGEGKVTPFDLQNFETQDASKALMAPREKIKACFDHYKLGDVWTREEPKFAAAIKKDYLRQEQFNNKIGKGIGAVIEADLIKVKVYVREKTLNGTIVLEANLDVQSTTRLTALRWYVARQIKDGHHAKVAATARFQRNNSGEDFRLDQDISEVVAGQKSCEMCLIL